MVSRRHRETEDGIPMRETEQSEDRSMKDRAGTTAAARTRPRPLAKRPTTWGVSLLLPLLMGGCPEFRNDLVDLVEEATRGALLSTQDPIAIADAATLSLVDAALDLFFGQFRGSQFQVN